MELGQRLRQARLDAGLSQRQLCGEEITRNMLSQIEHDTARPSMDTLRYLAGRLGKSVSFFLDEDALTSPNQTRMERARAAFVMGEMSEVLDALADYREPDEVYERERWLLVGLACIALAETAIDQERRLYALELLTRAAQAGEKSGYLTEETRRRRLLLLAKAQGKDLAGVCAQLPSLDDELRLRAAAALEAGDAARCAALLEAAENKEEPEWNLLRGKACMACGEYAQGAAWLHRAEDAFPETAALLERCYRELEDYKQAYLYACKQKK